MLADGGTGGYTGTSLVKVGTGTMTLSGVNTYTGATTVDGGTLAVNGSILSSCGVTVNTGGTLGGTGTVGNTTVNERRQAGARQFDRHAHGQRQSTFTAGGTYTVEVSPSAADRTNVTGAATLTGATVQAIALPGSFASQTYTILNASGGLGGTQFAGLNDTGSSLSPGARNPHLTYDANNVFLVLDPGTIQLPAGASGNQAGVAGGIDRAVLGGATPPAGFDACSISKAAADECADADLRRDRDGIAADDIQRMTQFMGMMTDPFIAGRDGISNVPGGASQFADTFDSVNAYAAKRPAGRGGLPNSSPKRCRAQRRVRGALERVGAAYGGGRRPTAIRRRVERHQPRVRRCRRRGLSVFAGDGGRFCAGRRRHQFRAPTAAPGIPTCSRPAPSFAIGGAAYLTAALAYGWQDVTTDRTVTIVGIERLRAHSTPMHGRAASKAATASSRRGWRRHHALCRRAVHGIRPAVLRREALPAPTPLRSSYGGKTHGDPQRTRPAHRQILRCRRRS